MPDGPDDLRPEQEDAVRRLLAGARHDEPLPPEVAARLDTLLGELVATRSARSNVHSLGRSRRQKTRLFLAAAAAAVVVAVVVPKVSTDRGGNDSAGSSSASDQSTTFSDGQEDSSLSAQGQSAPSAPAAERAAPSAAAGHVVLLVPATFDDDVRRLVQQGTGSKPNSSSLALSGLGPCGPAAYGTGRLRPAVYDGTLTVLAVRPPVVDGSRVVDLLECGTAVVLRSTTVNGQ